MGNLLEMLGLIRVKNITGTGDNPCKCCDSWIEHWIKHTKKSPTCCYACKEKKTYLVGGHVHKVSNIDQRWYIVPLCDSCNKKKESFGFYVLESDLVAARACEKDDKL